MARTTNGRLYTRKTKKHGTVYWLDYSLNGERFRQKLTDENGQLITQRKKAERAADRILHPYTAKDEVDRRRQAVSALEEAEEKARAADEANKPKLPIAEMWERYPYTVNTRGATERRLSETTIRDNRSQWAKFERWADKEEIKHAEDVTPETASQFREFLIDEDLSGNRVNKLILLCRVMFDLAGMEPNPFAGLRNRNHKPQGRRELTTAELQAVCQSAAGELRTLLAVGLYTGLRLGDSVTVQWSEFDAELSKLVREPSKTSYKGEKLVLPVHPVLQAILAETPASRRKGDVMSELSSIYRDSRSRLVKRIQDHFRKCGIRLHRPDTGYVLNEDGTIKRTGKNANDKVHTGKRAVVEVGFHSLRHSFVSICARGGVPLHVVQALCGHSSPQIQQLYLHASNADASKAIDSLPSLAADQVTSEEDSERARFRELADSLPIEQIRELLDTAAGNGPKNSET